MADVIIRVPPFSYIQLLDTNTNITRVVVGPQTVTRQEHEKVVLGPEKMVTVPPRHFIKIKNPVMRDEDGSVIVDKYGQAKLRFGDEEYRIHATSGALEPFPLYPGEKRIGAISRLLVVEKNEALHLKATRELEGHDAGEEWLFHGPATYIPCVEVEEVGLIKSVVVTLGSAPIEGDSQAYRLWGRRAQGWRILLDAMPRRVHEIHRRRNHRESESARAHREARHSPKRTKNVYGRVRHRAKGRRRVARNERHG